MVDNIMFVENHVPTHSSIHMHAYVGAHFVPIAVTESCCLMLPLNSKKMTF